MDITNAYASFAEAKRNSAEAATNPIISYDCFLMNIPGKPVMVTMDIHGHTKGGAVNR